MINPVEIGYILKTHGYKGDLKVRMSPNYIECLEGLDAVFLHIKSEYLPYFPDSVQIIADNEVILHFEGIKNKEEAQKIRGHKIYARNEDVDVIDESEAGVSELIGFTVEDIQLGIIGIVEDVYTLPQQELLAVRYNGKEVLIPVREELIHEFSSDKKTIVFNLPEGILDL